MTRPLELIDEFWYAQVIQGIKASGDWITPRFGEQPELKKPPLFFWLSALLSSAVPVRVAARLVAGLSLVALVPWVYRVAEPRVGRTAARLSALVLVLSYDPIQLHGFRAGVMAGPAILETALVFGLSLTLARHPGRLRWIGALIGLTALTKSVFAAIPVGIVVAACWLQRGRVRLSWGLVLQSGLLALAVPAPWLVLAYAANGWSLFETLLVDQALKRALADEATAEATARVWGRQEPLFLLRHHLAFGHPWVLLAGGAVARLIRRPAVERSEAEVMLRLAAVWALSVFALFLASRAAWPWYVSSAYVPIALLCGWLLSRFLEAGPARARSVFAFAVGAAFVLPTVLTHDPYRGAVGRTPLAADLWPMLLATLACGLALARRSCAEEVPRAILAGGAGLALLYAPLAAYVWGDESSAQWVVQGVPVVLAVALLGWASRATPPRARRACVAALAVVAAGSMLAPLRFAGRDRVRPEITRAKDQVERGEFTYEARYQYEFVVVYQALSQDHEVRYDEARRELTVRPR